MAPKKAVDYIMWGYGNREEWMEICRNILFKDQFFDDS